LVQRRWADLEALGCGLDRHRPILGLLRLPEFCDASGMTETIVVGYDDKEPAQKALRRAIDEARERNGRLVVIAVAEMPLNPADPRNFGTLDDGSFELGIEETPDLERALTDARDVIGPTQIEAEYVWAAGDPGRQIIDLARDRGASLIVIGGHHEGFFGRTFGMSVQDDVKKHADCDVIVVE
jgi:nucleotide-binding universal stress UspA family protein